MAFKHCIDVSPEMLSFVGAGALPAHDWPADAIVLAFAESPSVLTVDPQPTGAQDWGAAGLIFVVAREAVMRLAGGVPAAGSWHPTSALRELVLAIRDCGAPPAMGDTLRLAKSIELLCATFAAFDAGELIPTDGDGALSEHDARRMVLARRMIDDRWREKLTLDAVAQGCGINRAKLTSGFRTMFGVSVADAIAERRLGGARDLLLTTDLPVSSVGYACGYLNNASFTRAFARRFGMVPTRLRACGAAG